jgi:hypothetical protein
MIAGFPKIELACGCRRSRKSHKSKKSHKSHKRSHKSRRWG